MTEVTTGDMREVLHISIYIIWSARPRGVACASLHEEINSNK